MGSAKDALNGREFPLQVYLLGTVDFEALLRLQRRLHYEISGDCDQATLILCEHPPLITVGRHGSRAHILLEPQELALRGWRVRWVNRAGGCWLHQPGQLSAYALVPLDRLCLPLQAFQHRLGEVVKAWLSDFDIQASWHGGGAWAGDRMLAGLGLAVRSWVSYYGLCLNVNPLLDPYRVVRCSPQSHLPMTSLERERRGRVRPSLARERFVENFQRVFGFCRVSLFTEHPSLVGSTERSMPPRVASGA